MPLSSDHDRPLGIAGAPFIGGRFLARTCQPPVPHINPSNGRPQADLHLGGAEEIDQAVQAARAAQKRWAALPSHGRLQCFKRLGDLQGRHADEIAFLGARDPAPV
ncbi:aldehyde dehydrogenase family protein, partial [Ideonella sp. B508-1]|uniref:aldehyde dehydrogenase family protein n=1 Tax=Ideonella sp. B508-1 TaxID=137716 RepID=UPI00058C794C